jgi:ribose transport system permease protein
MNIKTILTPKVKDKLRDYVPFIAITLVILLFWGISGERFMSVRNWTFIAQQTPVVMLLAFAQLMIITTGSIDISVGSSLALSAFCGALGMIWLGDAGLILGIFTGGLIGLSNGLIISLLKIPSFVTTLAMLIIVRATVIIVSSGAAIYITKGNISGSGSNITSVTAPWLL